MTMGIAKTRRIKSGVLALTIVLSFLLLLRPVVAFEVMSHNHAHCDHDAGDVGLIHHHDGDSAKVADLTLVAADRHGDRGDTLGKVKCCGELCAAALHILPTPWNSAQTRYQFALIRDTSPVYDNRRTDLFRPPRTSAGI